MEKVKLNSNALPQVIIRRDMLCSGDVILSRRNTLTATIVAKATNGKYSHAAIVVDQGTIIEADKKMISCKAIKWLGTGVVHGQQSFLASLPYGMSTDIIVYRHPKLCDLPLGVFENALKEEMHHSYGADYSKLERLVGLVVPNEKIRSILCIIIRRIERLSPIKKVHGPFCSELVARIYNRMGLALFDQDRAPSEITPNDLAISLLKPVNDIIVRLNEVEEFKEFPSCSPSDALHSNRGDVIALLMHNERLCSQNINETSDYLYGAARKNKEHQLLLVGTFIKGMYKDFLICAEASGKIPHTLAMRLLLLNKQYINFLPTIERLLNNKISNSQETFDCLTEMGKLRESLTVCTILCQSNHMRRLILNCSGYWKRYRLTLKRKRLLCNARQVFQNTRRVMKEEKRRMLDTEYRWAKRDILFDRKTRLFL